jgi:tetratricopeptide (TPR) repeat protein
MAKNRFDLLKEMLQKDPEDNFLNYALALEYSRQSEVSKAIRIIETILVKDETYLPAYYQLGKLYEQEAMVDKAIDIYKRGIDIAKKDNNLKTMGELTEALMILEEDY